MTDGVFQQTVNKRIEFWKERYPRFISGKQAIREFTEFAFDADTRFSIAETINTHYSPDRAKLLSHELSNHRLRQLHRGADLTGHEWGLWKQVMDHNALNCEYVSINHLRDSNGISVWFAVTMNGFHLTSSIVDAAGPFWSHEEAILYCAGKVRVWFGWWMPTLQHSEGAATREKIEQITRMRCEDFHSLVA